MIATESYGLSSAKAIRSFSGPCSSLIEICQSTYHSEDGSFFYYCDCIILLCISVQAYDQVQFSNNNSLVLGKASLSHGPYFSYFYPQGIYWSTSSKLYIHLVLDEAPVDEQSVQRPLESYISIMTWIQCVPFNQVHATVMSIGGWWWKVPTRPLGKWLCKLYHSKEINAYCNIHNWCI